MTATGRTAPREVLRELPADSVLIDPDVLGSYAHDESRFTEYAIPAAVLLPRSTAQVSACLAAAHRHGVRVVPRGAGSGLSGGPTPPPLRWCCPRTG